MPSADPSQVSDDAPPRGQRQASGLPALTRRQGLATFVVAVTIGLLAACAQMFLEWQSMHARVPQQVERTLTQIDPTATQALYQLSGKLGQAVMDSLKSRYPDVDAVIYDELGEPFTQTDGAAGDSGPLAHLLFGDITAYSRAISSETVPELGRLEVTISAQRLTEDFLSRAQRILWTTMLGVLAIAAVLMAVFHYIVTSPLLRLAEAVGQVDTRAPGQWQLPQPRGHKGDEIGRLASAFNAVLTASQAYLDSREKAQAELEETNRELERRVAERTRELEQTAADLSREKGETERALADLQRANARMAESLSYAEAVQRGMLPPLDAEGMGLRAIASWWAPRDQVGGDMYYTARRGDVTLVALLDCTGHGVPGALISFAAVTVLDRVVSESGSWSPSTLLARLDKRLRRRLHSHVWESEQDDGLEAGIACIDSESGEVTYAGVGINLFVTGENEPVSWVTGARGGIGYRFIAPFPENLPEHEVMPGPQTTLCLPSDGILEQLDAAGRRQLGRRQFARMLQSTIAEGDLDQRLAALATRFDQWRGTEPQRDDISLVAFQVR